MHSNSAPNPGENSPSFIVRRTVSALSAACQRRRGREPTYPLGPLLALTGLALEEFAEAVGISRATAYRRAKDGVKWSEADEWAVAFRYLPYEVWPEWDLADPIGWCEIPPDPEQAADNGPPATGTHAAA
jgi:hypothetical protein